MTLTRSSSYLCTSSISPVHATAAGLDSTPLCCRHCSTQKTDGRGTMERLCPGPQSELLQRGSAHSAFAAFKWTAAALIVFPSLTCAVLLTVQVARVLGDTLGGKQKRLDLLCMAAWIDLLFDNAKTARNPMAAPQVPNAVAAFSLKAYQSTRVSSASPSFSST